MKDDTAGCLVVGRVLMSRAQLGVLWLESAYPIEGLPSRRADRRILVMYI